MNVENVLRATVFCKKVGAGAEPKARLQLQLYVEIIERQKMVLFLAAIFSKM